MNVCAIQADDDDHRDPLLIASGKLTSAIRVNTYAHHMVPTTAVMISATLTVDANTFVLDLDRLVVLALSDARMRNVLEELFHLRNRDRCRLGGYVRHLHFSSTVGARRWRPIARYRETMRSSD